jgi:hypothetical protein
MTRLGSTPRTIVALALLVFFPLSFRAGAADSSPASTPQIEISTLNSGPRTMEALTQQNIVRHYGRAWQSLADAFDHNTPVSLNDYFVGAAKDQLTETVNDQQRTGIHSRYLDQRHMVDVVFYAPEGDVVMLHDTVQCDLEVYDGEKSIHTEQAVLHYVVLMTPGADRWVIRQLQAVPQF